MHQIKNNLFFIFLFSFSSLFSQNFLKTDGKLIVNEVGDTILLRGMGLGGWMVQEGYMMSPSGFSGTQHQIKKNIEKIIGEEETKKFYNLWLDNHVRKIDIDSMKSWGFNLVRAPIHYNLFTLPIEEEQDSLSYTGLTKGFILLDSLLSWCEKNEMYLMIDLHAAPGGQGYNADISDYDTTKYSLWESEHNQSKTVELWRRISERYKDKEWIAGYDLINEPNWEIPEGILLRDLYERITDAIRNEGDKHILFIEGNWFANDFTGLTPPWDDNIVYSPHKYWSPVDQGFLDWLLPLRDTLNVPLFIGETGENSNLWYRDAVKVFEENGVGWAWWPLKRIGAIQPPLSINYNKNYNKLVDFWKNDGPEPTKSEAISGLLQLAEDIKLENCFFHRDIIDAMFRQPYSNETIPYSNNFIPGKIHASNFDMGVMGYAYYDAGSNANYGGNFSAWNSGWALRNDNVDIQLNQDTLSNGYNVGWTETDEWMKYSIIIDSSGLYNVDVRVATEDNDGSFYFKIENDQISEIVKVPKTDSWEDWINISVDSLVIYEDNKELYFYVNKGTFNLSYFNFKKIGKISDVESKYISSFTNNENSILVTLNKNINQSLDINQGDFNLSINNQNIDIQNVSHSSLSSRSILLELSQLILPTDTLLISYNGNSIKTTDNLNLKNFQQEVVKNNISFIFDIPGKIEAEYFYFQKGIEVELTTDIGGGQNIGSLDDGDYAEYFVNIIDSGTYNVTFRSAADPAWSSGGQLELSIYDSTTTNYISLQNIVLPQTGGWQQWKNTSKGITLPKGEHIIRLKVIQGPFNLNWFSFDDSESLGLPVPGKIEAEDYVRQEGVTFLSQSNSDIQYIGYLDSADYTDYIIDVKKSGIYDLSYRVASDGNQSYANGGKIELQKILESGDNEILHTITFPATNGWEDWVTFNNFPKINLEMGEIKIRMMYKKTPFNLDWVLFEEFTGEVLGLELNNLRIKVFPNPTKGTLKIESDFVPKEIINYKIVDILGSLLFERNVNYTSEIKELINLNNISSNMVFLIISEGDKVIDVRRVIKEK